MFTQKLGKRKTKRIVFTITNLAHRTLLLVLIFTIAFPFVPQLSNVTAMETFSLDELTEVLPDEPTTALPGEPAAVDRTPIPDLPANELETAEMSEFSAFSAEVGVLTYTIVGTSVTITDCETTATSADVAAALQQFTNNGQRVIAIGDRAFRDCTALTSISLPNTVQTIGSSAFWNTKLTSVTLPSALTTCATDYMYAPDYRTCGPFGSIPTLQTITFADGITTIPSNVLYGTESVTSITIPDSVTSIGERAFDSTSIKNVTLPAYLNTIGTYAFANTKLETVGFPSRVETINADAFYGCTSLSQINLPTASLKSIGSRAFWNTALTNITLPSSLTTCGTSGLSGVMSGPFASISTLTTVTFADNVTTIPNYVLRGTGSVTSITIPQSVTAIGDYAFEGTSIRGVTLQANLRTIGNYAFANSDLETVTFPSRVETIGQNAFSGCTYLSQINLPATSLTSIGRSAFWDTALTSVTLPTSLATCGTEYLGNRYGGPFASIQTLKTVTFANGATTIPNYVLSGTSSVTSVSMPSTVTSIGDDAFYGTRISSVALPANLKTIGSYAFANTDLEAVSFPSKVDTIGESAFSGCKYLTQIDLPTSSLTNIGRSAFWDTTLTNVTLPSTLTTCGTAYLSSSGYGGPFASIPTLQTVAFASGMTAIPAYVLYGTDSVTSVTIPSTVTSIGNYAFESTSIDRVTLPAELKTLGQYAFANTDLEIVNFPSKVETIGNYAFDGCKYLTQINLPSSSLKSIGGGAFWDTKLTVVTLPASLTTTSSSSPFASIPTLQTVIFANGTIIIPAYVLYGTDSVVNVSIPSTVTTIGNYAFAGANSIEGIFIPPSVSSISNTAFSNRNINLIIIGKVGSYAQDYAEANNIPFVPDTENFVTLNTDDSTNSTTINVFGTAPYGKVVNFYDNDMFIGTFTPNRAYRYSGTLMLASTEENSIHEISAKIFSANDKTVLAEASHKVLYQKSSPHIKEFYMLHDGQKIDLVSTDGRRQTLIFRAGRPFTFEVKMENSDMVDKLFICSERDGETAMLEAKYDASKGVFVATGIFNNNSNYVPGEISVQLLAKGTRTPLDFSELTTSEISIISNNLGDAWDNAQYDIIVNTEKKLEVNVTLNDNDQTNFTVIFENTENVGLTETQLIAGGYEKITAIDGTVKWVKTEIIDGQPSVGLAPAWKTNIYDTISNASSQISLFADIANNLEQGSAPWGKAFGWASFLFGTAGKAVNLDSALDIIAKCPTMSAADKLKASIDVSAAVSLAVGINVLVAKGSELAWKAGLGPGVVAGLIGYKISLDMESVIYKNNCLIHCGYGDKSGFTKGGYQIAIDPSGYIYEAVTSNRLQGVTTTAYYKENATAASTLWKADEWDQYNPLTSDTEGRYAWDVPEGLWQVKAEKAGYVTAYSEWLPVPPPQTNVNIAMVSTAPPSLLRFNVYDAYAEVEFSQYMQPETLGELTLKNSSGATVPYTLSYSTSEAAIDGTVYAKVYKLVYTDAYTASGGTYTLQIPNTAKNYAGTAMVATNKTAEFAREITLILPGELTLVYGQTTVVSVKAENYDPVHPLTLQAYSDFESIAKVVTAGTFDTNGDAQITVEGLLPGETNLVINIPEIGTLRIIPLTVSMEAEESSSIVITPGSASVTKGGSQQFTATKDGAAISVVWSLSGNDKSGTTIGENGLLTVDAEETAATLTITAAYEDETASATVRVTSPQSYILGDVNGDGAVSAPDRMYLARYLARWPGYDLPNEAAADVDRNGSVTASDRMYLARYLARWPGYTLD